MSIQFLISFDSVLFRYKFDMFPSAQAKYHFFMLDFISDYIYLMSCNNLYIFLF